MVQAAAFYFVAVPHYMSTYTFFLGDDNLQYYRSRRLAFFGGPAFITLAVSVLWVLRFPPVIQAAVFVWNVWHVARQNSGILAMYRRLNAGSHTEHLPANLAILGVSAGMAFWHIDRYPPTRASPDERCTPRRARCWPWPASRWAPWRCCCTSAAWPHAIGPPRLTNWDSCCPAW